MTTLKLMHLFTNFVTALLFCWQVGCQ